MGCVEAGDKGVELTLHKQVDVEGGFAVDPGHDAVGFWIQIALERRRRQRKGCLHGAEVLGILRRLQVGARLNPPLLREGRVGVFQSPSFNHGEGLVLRSRGPLECCGDGRQSHAGPQFVLAGLG